MIECEHLNSKSVNCCYMCSSNLTALHNTLYRYEDAIKWDKKMKEERIENLINILKKFLCEDVKF